MLMGTNKLLLAQTGATGPVNWRLDYVDFNLVEGIVAMGQASGVHTSGLAVLLQPAATGITRQIKSLLLTTTSETAVPIVLALSNDETIGDGDFAYPADLTRQAPLPYTSDAGWTARQIKGDAGPGIVAAQNVDDQLVLTLETGVVLPPIALPAGPAGADGEPGPPGGDLTPMGVYSGATAYEAGNYVTGPDDKGYYIPADYVGTVTGTAPPASPWVADPAAAAATQAAASAALIGNLIKKPSNLRPGDHFTDQSDQIIAFVNPETDGLDWPLERIRTPQGFEVRQFPRLGREGEILQTDAVGMLLASLYTGPGAETPDFTPLAADLVALQGEAASLFAKFQHIVTPWGAPKTRLVQPEAMVWTREYLTGLAMGYDRQLHLMTLGDSFLHNQTRITGLLACLLADEYGDGGSGITSFAFSGTPSSSNQPGNARGYIYTLAFSDAAHWSCQFNTAKTPCRSVVSSSTAGAWIEYTSPYSYDFPDLAALQASTASTSKDPLRLYRTTDNGNYYKWRGPLGYIRDYPPDHTEAYLHYQGTEAGGVRIRYTVGGVDGAWSGTISLVGDGTTQRLKLPDPPSGKWKIRIEVVGNNLVKLAEIHPKSTAPGIVVSKAAGNGGDLDQMVNAYTDAACQAVIAAMVVHAFILGSYTNDESDGDSGPTWRGKGQSVVAGLRTAAGNAPDIAVIVGADNPRTGNLIGAYAAEGKRMAIENHLTFNEVWCGPDPAQYAAGGVHPLFVDDGADGAPENDAHPSSFFGGFVWTCAYFETITGRLPRPIRGA